MKNKISTKDSSLSKLAEQTKRIKNFTVRYQLYVSYFETHQEYYITLTKAENGIDIDTSTIKNFTSNEKEALKIYQALIDGNVTPMCLEDCVLELL